MSPTDDSSGLPGDGAAHHLAERLHKLIEMLERDETWAVEEFQILRQSLSTVIGDNNLEPLGRAIQVLDVPSVISEIEAVVKMLT